MPYIESDTALPGHHKTVRAARLLSCRRSEIIGCLHCLWSWALTNAQDGDLSGFDVETIAEAADWPGDADAFIQALLDCGKKGLGDTPRGPGFLEKDEDGRIILHDWFTQGGGKLVEHRQNDAYKKWLARNKRPDSAEAYDEWKDGPKRHKKPSTPASAPVQETPSPSNSGVSVDVSTTSEGHHEDIDRHRDIEQRSVAELSVSKPSVANSSSSVEESLRGDPESTASPSPPGPSGAAAAAEKPDGLGERKSLVPGVSPPAEGENPHSWVCRSLKLCPAHWETALTRRWGEVKALGQGRSEYGFKRKVLWAWVSGEEPAPEAPRRTTPAPLPRPKPPQRDNPATPGQNGTAQGDPEKPPQHGIPASLDDFRAGLAEKLAMSSDKPTPPKNGTSPAPVIPKATTVEEKAIENARIESLLADLERDPGRKAEVVGVVNIVIPADVKANEAVYTATLESQIRRWARDQVRSGNYSAPNIPAGEAG